jgi:hypothetical protein
MSSSGNWKRMRVAAPVTNRPLTGAYQLLVSRTAAGPGLPLVITIDSQPAAKIEKIPVRTIQCPGFGKSPLSRPWSMWIELSQ